MKTTLFKIVVPASGDASVVVPDTGVISNVEPGSQSAILIPVVFTMLAIAIVAIITFVMLRKDHKFNIRKSSTGLSLVVLMMFGVLSLVGGAIYSGGRASATEITPDFSTSGTVEVEAELDEEESIEVCGTDTITINQDLSGGYSLFMHANDMVNDSNEEAKIIPATTDGEPLTDGTWGYWVVPDMSGLPEGTGFIVTPHPVPSTTTKIIEKTTSVTAGYTQEIDYCAVLGPDTEPGTYSTTIKYEMSSTDGSDEGDDGGDDGGDDDQTLIMQEVSEWGNTLKIGDEVIAKDIRDDKKYHVARLADGNIWMTQNLDHDIKSDEGFYTYENTDIGHGSTPDPNAKWTGVATHATDDHTWAAEDTLPESYDPGDLCWNGEFSEVDGQESSNPLEDCANQDDKHYHIGNYYNWTAAVAMSNSSAYSWQDEDEDDMRDADQSICPAGWTLSKYSGDGSFSALARGLAAGENGDIHEEPYYLVYGGIYTVDGVISAGYAGNYATSIASVSSDTTAMAFRFLFDNNSAIITTQNTYRRDGWSIRCVAR